MGDEGGRVASGRFPDGTMQRRTFLKSATALLQTLTAMAVGVPVVRFLLDPFRRSQRQADFVRVAPLSALSTGNPVRVVVQSDHQDTYMRYPLGPVGSVWFVPGPDANGPPRCFQTICPHLGCGIDYLAAHGVFSCPCHASDFDAAGAALSGPSPRGMDALECRLSEPDDTGERWVEVYYQEFQTGDPERRPLA